MTRGWTTKAVMNPRTPKTRTCGLTLPSRLVERKMKALVKRRSEPGLWLEDVPEPVVGINDVLIKVDRTGICGTDVHIYKWDEWARRTIPVPLVVGHEFVGEV